MAIDLDKICDDLYEGKDVICIYCGKGYFRSDCPPDVATTFTCEYCKKQIIFN